MTKLCPLVINFILLNLENLQIFILIVIINLGFKLLFKD